MRILGAIAQLRTTDLAASIQFYTDKLGLTLAFQYEDFYAGIRAGDQHLHLKRIDDKDPSIAFVARSVGTSTSTSRPTTPTPRRSRCARPASAS